MPNRRLSIFEIENRQLKAFLEQNELSIEKAKSVIGENHFQAFFYHMAEMREHVASIFHQQYAENIDFLKKLVTSNKTGAYAALENSIGSRARLNDALEANAHVYTTLCHYIDRLNNYGIEVLEQAGELAGARA